MCAHFKNSISVRGFSQKFMVSLLLHGIVLFCMACLWSGHSASMMPVFQSGEFSLELGLAAPPPAPATVASAPMPADPPVEDVAKDPEEPAAPVEDMTEEEEPDSLQLAAIMHPPPAAAPDVTDNPTPQSAAPPISGAANPGVPNVPHMESHIRPVYPASARLWGEEGVVTVCTIIASSEKAQSAEVLRSSGFPALDQAAVNAVRRARFIPARNGRRAVESQILLAFRFTLVD